MQTYQYRDITFEVPEMPKNGINFKPAKNFNVLDTNFLNNDWNLNEFNKVNLPISIGKFTPPNDSWSGLRILDMPIKFPGNSEYYIPKPLQPYLVNIHNVACSEMTNVKNHEDFYCYITIDEKVIQPNESPRNGGCHVDGFQGSRINPKTRIDHSYIAVTDCPTVFYNQSFPCSHLDESKHNFFKYWDSIAKNENEVFIETNKIYLMDAYTVHRSNAQNKLSKRIFFRMSYSVREFDRLGNTHNPMINYNWEMVPRNMAANLIAPE